MKRPVYSIRWLIVLTSVTCVAGAWIAHCRNQVYQEQQIVTRLRNHEVIVEEQVPKPNIVESALGIQLRKSTYKVSLGFRKTDHLEALKKLEFLEELNVVLDYNPQTLTVFAGLKNLRTLDISDWFAPVSMHGIEQLPNLEVLAIAGVEDPERIDLNPLADHPTLTEFWIDGYAFDQEHQFQNLPDWD